MYRQPTFDDNVNVFTFGDDYINDDLPPYTPFNPKEYIGFESERSYQHFFNNKFKYNQRNKKMMHSVERFIEAFESKECNEVLSIKYCVIPSSSSYVIFTGCILETSHNNNTDCYIDIKKVPTVSAKKGFKCHYADFVKFLLWNLLKRPEKWFSLRLSGCEDAKLEASLYLHCFGHCNVKLNTQFRAYLIPDDHIYNYTKIIFMNRDASHWRLKRKKQEMIISFLMGNHKRLGQNSPIQLLCIDVIGIIICNVDALLQINE